MNTQVTAYSGLGIDCDGHEDGTRCIWCPVGSSDPFSILKFETHNHFLRGLSQTPCATDSIIL